MKVAPKSGLSVGVHSAKLTRNEPNAPLTLESTLTFQMSEAPHVHEFPAAYSVNDPKTGVLTEKQITTLPAGSLQLQQVDAKKKQTTVTGPSKGNNAEITA